MPFSDPLADGPVIQRASERALCGGTTMEQVLKLAKEIRQRSQVGMILFTYYNPVLRMGLAKFATAAKDAGLDGALITDLPVEEAAPYLKEMRARDLATVFLAAPTSTDDAAKSIAQTSTGFVYAVSRTGVTGARKQIDRRWKKIGPAATQVHEIAGCRRLWHLHAGAVCSRGRVCGGRRCRQRHC